MNKGFPSSSAITFAIILLTTGLVNCGTIPRHVQKRIINGVDSEYVPYVTMVTGYNLHYGTFGGGSFVTLQHVLTAANLIYNMEYWYIDYGKASVGNMPYAEIHKGIHHPEYDPESFANDIGILFLNQPVDPGKRSRFLVGHGNLNLFFNCPVFSVGPTDSSTRTPKYSV